MSSGPTRIRAQSRPEGGAVVRMLMQHEMESGQRKDPSGRRIPAWHIAQVAVRLNGVVVLDAQWGPAVAKDPYLQFTLKTARPGDRLVVAWTDNRGEQRSDEALVI